MENFNGLLSLILAVIELVIILFLAFKAEKNKINILSISLMRLLFAYQFVEFLICGLDMRTSLFAYFALLAVTFMPPLSLYISLRLLNFNDRRYSLIFLPAIFFSIYYLFVVGEFAVTSCTVVYATYNYPLGFLYGLFYYLPILTTIIMLGYNSYVSKISSNTNLSKILFLGYTITFIPGFIFTRVVPGMLEAAESILCTFAFILFLFISYFVLKNKNKPLSL
ncbi:MAG: hypothetical protein H6613_11700 [Ignavibacteriales bacterium]|nr:hypothetical protein [Ignavibacteriales bacterium]